MSFLVILAVPEEVRVLYGQGIRIGQLLQFLFIGKPRFDPVDTAFAESKEHLAVDGQVD
jgi:hypothetical protein